MHTSEILQLRNEIAELSALIQINVEELHRCQALKSLSALSLSEHRKIINAQKLSLQKKLYRYRFLSQEQLMF